MEQQTQTFADFVAERFGGVLYAGEHEPNGQACALEAYSQWRGLEWTDDPDDLDMPDLRALNDAAWTDDEARTAALVPVVETLADWREWSDERRQKWAERVAERHDPGDRAARPGGGRIPGHSGGDRAPRCPADGGEALPR